MVPSNSRGLLGRDADCCKFASFRSLCSFRSFFISLFFFLNQFLDSNLEFCRFFKLFLYCLQLSHCKLFANLIVQPLYIGAAATKVDDETVRIGITIHDGVYSVNTRINQLIARDGHNIQHLIKVDVSNAIRGHEAQHWAKFVGAGVTLGPEKICPEICAFLWNHLDIVSMALPVRTTACDGFEDARAIPVDVDEQSDSAARKCVMHFGPNHNPALAIAFRNQVMPDAQGAIKLFEDLSDYQATVYQGTWNTVLKSYELRGYKDGQTEGDPQCPPTKIAFFSATP